MDNGVEIHGEPGAILLFDYSGENENVCNAFSILALTNNNVVDGITIEVNRNCQYLIHDDFADLSVKGKNIIRNCIFKGVQCSSAVIGAGLGNDMVYEIRENLFLQDYSTEGYESETFDKISIMYHSCSNPEYAEAKSIIIIEGNICNGKINFWKMGNFMEPSTAIVYNNVATNIECIYHPRCAGNDNIVMYDFNNNIMEEE